MREEDGEKGKWGGEAQREVLVGETQYIERDEEEVCLGHYRGNGARSASLPSVLPLAYNTESSPHANIISLALQ